MRQQRARGHPEYGMAPTRRDVEQRHQDESPVVHLGVRQDEAARFAPTRRPADTPAAVVENVDVESARTPPATGAPPGPPFDPLQEP